MQQLADGVDGDPNSSTPFWRFRVDGDPDDFVAEFQSLLSNFPPNWLRFRLTCVNCSPNWLRFRLTCVNCSPNWLRFRLTCVNWARSLSWDLDRAIVGCPILVGDYPKLELIPRGGMSRQLCFKMKPVGCPKQNFVSKWSLSVVQNRTLFQNEACRLSKTELLLTQELCFKMGCRLSSWAFV
jgi:hypothetical protein